MVSRCSFASLLLLVACGDAADDPPASDAATPSHAGGDAAVDAGSPSPYGDGTCTEAEFQEGLGVIETSRNLAAEGPNAVSAFIDHRREEFDGLWADCVERFCPVAKQITDECLANFAGEADAGVEHGPSCYPLPEECVAILAELDAGS